MERLAAHWGLDRLPQHRGYDALHGWFVFHHRWPESHPPTAFGSGVGFGGGVPEVGDIITREEFTVADSTGEPWTIVDERRSPVAHMAAIEAAWDHTRESLSEFKARLTAEWNEALDEEIVRLADAYENAGYAFQDTRPALQKHLGWVYHRLAYRKSCWAIAVDEFTSEATVRNATKNLRDELGFERFPTATK